MKERWTRPEVIVALSLALVGCGKSGTPTAGVSLEDLNIEPQKYVGQVVTVDCKIATFVALDGRFSGGCASDNNAVPQWALAFDLAGLAPDSMRQIFKKCGDSCRATVKGTFAKTVFESHVLVAQSIEVNGLRVEAQSPEAMQAQLSQNGNESVDACRQLASAARETLVLQGADEIELTGYFDRKERRCLLRKRFAFPEGNPMAGAVELSLHLASNEDEWLAKCSDIAGVCYLGSKSVGFEGDRATAFKKTEQYMDELVRGMEIAYAQDGVDQGARDAAEAESEAMQAADEALRVAQEASAEPELERQATMEGRESGVARDGADGDPGNCEQGARNMAEVYECEYAKTEAIVEEAELALRAVLSRRNFKDQLTVLRQSQETWKSARDADCQQQYDEAFDEVGGYAEGNRLECVQTHNEGRVELLNAYAEICKTADPSDCVIANE